jgi:hypothetical protein
VSSAVQRTAHALGETPGQGETQTEAGRVVGVAVPLEGQERALALILGDALAAVRDRISARSPVSSSTRSRS